MSRVFGGKPQNLGEKRSDMMLPTVRLFIRFTWIATILSFCFILLVSPVFATQAVDKSHNIATKPPITLQGTTEQDLQVTTVSLLTNSTWITRQVNSTAFVDVSHPSAVAYTNTIYAAWDGGIVANEHEIFFTKSTDGGVTWLPDVQLTNHEGGYYVSPPSLTVANDGTIYITYVYYHYWPNDDQLYVLSSNDEGQTWSQIIPFVQKSLSDSRIIADKGSGELYLVWVEGGNDMDLMFSRSQDDGTTWGTKGSIFSSNYEEWGGTYNIDSVDSGVIYVAVPYIGGVDIFQSLDGGQFWQQLVSPTGSDDSVRLAAENVDKAYLLDHNYTNHTSSLFVTNMGGVLGIVKKYRKDIIE